MYCECLPKETKGDAILSVHFIRRDTLKAYTPAARQSASVLKVSAHTGSEWLKEVAS